MCTYRIVFLENNPALGVTQDSPGDTRVLQLLNGDFTSESAIWLVIDVLGGDLEAFAEVFAGEEKVEGRRGNDNL